MGGRSAGIPGADPLMVDYHDTEWGVPVRDDAELFERLALEAFQAGTVVGHDPAQAAGVPGSVCWLRSAGGGRLQSGRSGSAAWAMPASCATGPRSTPPSPTQRPLIATAEQFGSFAAYLESMVPPPPLRQPRSATSGDIPATTAASDALSRDLRGRGFGFVGSTIVYAFMQSVGLVDDHLPGCFRYVG